MKTIGLSFLFSVVVVLVTSQTLDDVIYKTVEGNPCVWLVGPQGGVGCHTKKEGPVGILQHLGTSGEVKGFFAASSTSDPLSYILVIPAKLLADEQIISILQSVDVKDGSVVGLSKTVVGMLVLDSENPSLPFSPAAKNPDQFTEKDDKDAFYWNPKANSLLHKAMPFPLWHLGKEDSEDVLGKALANKNATGYPYHSAQITAFMHPQTLETSSLCVERSSCQPLGGRSTYASILPLNDSLKKEIVLAVASMDTASLFQLKTIGANAEMSGTVALMAAMDALLSKGVTPPTKWVRNVIFAWFDAESWGYLGSKQFIRNIKSFECKEYSEEESEDAEKSCVDPMMPSLEFQKIKLEKIHSILEAKQVGGKGSELFVHQPSKDFTLPPASTLLSVGNTMTKVKVSDAIDSRTPSVPPSSVTGILQEEASLAAKTAVIADHSAEYKNQFYHSIFDTAANVDNALVCEAATLLARSLSLLARDVTTPDTESNNIGADCSLVDTLLFCLTQNSTCDLVRKFIPLSPDYKGPEWPVHYSGVFSAWSSSSRSLHQKFINSWATDRISIKGANCSKQEDCHANETCLASKCQHADVYFHPASTVYLNRAFSEWYGNYYWVEENKTSNFWTESDWTPITLRLFKQSNPQIDYLFLGVSFIEIIVTLLFCFVVRKYFPEKIKIL